MDNEQVPPSTPNEENNTNTPPQPPEEPKTEGSGVGDNKALAIIGYIIPILFFIPLVTGAKDNEFAKYHANQQLNLLLFLVIGHAVGGALAFIMIGFLILPIVNIGGIILIILGVINVVNGEMKELPVIGKFRLIK
jgi:uncharacterized membrane protein